MKAKVIHANTADALETALNAFLSTTMQFEAEAGHTERRHPRIRLMTQSEGRIPEITVTLLYD